jgi:acetolactate synthase regulatory subunit
MGACRPTGFTIAGMNPAMDTANITIAMPVKNQRSTNLVARC